MDLSLSADQLAGVSLEDLIGGQGVDQVVDSRLLDKIEDALKGSLALLESSKGKTSIFATAPVDRSLKNNKLISNRAELDAYRQDVEAYSREIIGTAKAIESQLQFVESLSANRPLHKLRNEVQSLREELHAKDVLLESHLRRLVAWRQELGQLQALHSIAQSEDMQRPATDSDRMDRENG